MIPMYVDENLFPRLRILQGEGFVKETDDGS